MSFWSKNTLQLATQCCIPLSCISEKYNWMLKQLILSLRVDWKSKCNRSLWGIITSFALKSSSKYFWLMDPLLSFCTFTWNLPIPSFIWDYRRRSSSLCCCCFSWRTFSFFDIFELRYCDPSSILPCPIWNIALFNVIYIYRFVVLINDLNMTCLMLRLSLLLIWLFNFSLRL